MRDPLAFVIGMGVLLLAGLVVGLLHFSPPALIVGLVLAIVGFVTLLSRDSSFEQEIDDLLHRHAEETRRQA